MIASATADSRLRIVLLLVLAAGLAGFTILQGIAPHDEGLMLQAGARIASGQWPYRDFWTNYMPGQELVLAGMAKVLGPSLLAWRIVYVGEAAAISLLAYLLALRRAAVGYALLAWLAVAGAMAFPSVPGPNAPALLLALAALLISRRRPVLAGALAGLTCCFRLELGLATILALWLELPSGHRARALMTAIICAIVSLAPFVAVAPHAMFHDTIGFYSIQGLQRLPFPLDFKGPLRPSKLIEFYIPLILVASLALWVLAMVAATRSGGRHGLSTATRLGAVSLAPRRGRLMTPARATVPEMGAWSLAPLALVGLSYLLGRTDEFHLVPLAAVLPVMLAWAAALAPNLALRVALVVALVLIVGHGLERRAGQLLHPPALALVPGSAADEVRTDPADARSLSQLEHKIAVLTSPREPIFVANPRFDLVQAGDPLLYVILDHPNVTRYDVMQPGVVTTASVQREIVASLQRSRTRVVIRWLDPRASQIEPNGSGRSSGVHILDRYLRTDFHPVAQYGVYQVLLRTGTGTRSGP